MIPAHSPQAKGRVARRVHTVQARVVKERRLAAVSTLAAANQFLAGYLPRSKQRGTGPPAQVADLHRPRPPRRALDRTLGIKTTRGLRRDWTGAHHGHLSQGQPTVRATQGLVEEPVDGTLRITHQGRPLAFQAITSRPVKGVKAKTVHLPRRPVPPRPEHPWRRPLRPEHRTPATMAKP